MQQPVFDAVDACDVQSSLNLQSSGPCDFSRASDAIPRSDQSHDQTFHYRSSTESEVPGPAYRVRTAPTPRIRSRHCSQTTRQSIASAVPRTRPCGLAASKRKCQGQHALLKQALNHAGSRRNTICNLQFDTRYHAALVRGGVAVCQGLPQLVTDNRWRRFRMSDGRTLSGAGLGEARLTGRFQAATVSIRPTEIKRNIIARSLTSNFWASRGISESSSSPTLIVAARTNVSGINTQAAN